MNRYDPTRRADAGVARPAEDFASIVSARVEGPGVIVAMAVREPDNREVLG
jgi:hypothetical protein